MSDKARNICGVIYPDDVNYVNYINYIQKHKYYAILHNKSKDENGNIKKVHLHFCIRFDNPVSMSAFCKAMGLPENYIQRCSDLKSYIRYLIHIDEPDKEHYPITEILSNDMITVNNAFAPPTEVDFIQEFLKWYDAKLEKGFIISYRQVLGWVLKMGYYENYKKSYKILSDLIRERSI